MNGGIYSMYIPDDYEYEEHSPVNSTRVSMQNAHYLSIDPTSSKFPYMAMAVGDQLDYTESNIRTLDLEKITYEKDGNVTAVNLVDEYGPVEWEYNRIHGLAMVQSASSYSIITVQCP
jgi:hypothetical protein